MMVNVSESKASLSKPIDRIRRHREKAVIAKGDPPVADSKPPRPVDKRKLGLLKGEFDAPDQILFESDEEIEEMFYGDDDRVP